MDALTVMAIVLVWMLGGAVTASGFLAYSQKQWPTIAAEMRREDIGVSIFFGFGFVPPVSWLICPLMTGLYKHGFDWRWIMGR